MAKPTPSDVPVSLLLATIKPSQESGQGEEGREDQPKGGARDIGWHIRNLLELVSWAGT